MQNIKYEIKKTKQIAIYIVRRRRYISPATIKIDFILPFV